MFSFFSPFPYLRILCLWVIGILIYQNLYFVILVPFLCLHVNKQLFVTLVLVGLSFLRTSQLANDSNSSIPQHNAFVFQIKQPPTQGPKSWIIRADVLAWRLNGHWDSGRTACLLYVPLKGPTFNVGQVYQGLGKLKVIRTSLLPYAFDWKRFYAAQGIHASTFIPRLNLVKLHDATPRPHFYSLLRDQAKYYLHQALPPGVHRNVADAMFLGIGNSLDFDTRQSYAALGAIHILSVSGMHVGLLFLGLRFLFGFILRYRTWGSWVFFSLIMAAIWTYAAMTGFSAPVMRSVWMFSVMLFAQVFRWQSHPVNSWAFSGLVLLIIQPMDLFQVGFQLSYAAVLGLILFQSRLVNLWKPKYWLISQVWELTCVAMSAQIFTWPLIIYYFHQFPNPFYFFLLNPILVFLSTITLGLGFLFLLLAPLISFIPYVYSSLGYLLWLSFESLHGLMFSTTNRFHTVLSFVRLNGVELICYYVCLGLLWIWWIRRQIHSLYLSITLVAVTLLFRLMEPIKDEAYLTLSEKNLVFLRAQDLYGQLYGEASAAWLQSNVSGWWAANQVVDTLSRKWPKGSFTWHDQGEEFVYLKRPSNQSVQHPVHLILAADLDFRDPRFLSTWQSSTWYFMRKPSEYLSRKLKPYWPKKVIYLSEQEAVYFP